MCFAVSFSHFNNLLPLMSSKSISTASFCIAYVVYFFWLDFASLCEQKRAPELFAGCVIRDADALMSLILLFYGIARSRRKDGNDIDDNGVIEFLKIILGSKVPGMTSKHCLVVAALKHRYAYNKQHIKLSEHFLKQTKLETSVLSNSV